MKISLSSFQIGSFFALCSAFLFSTKAIFIKQTYA
ncbi:EamA family transporter, partial [Acinetobacter baumannii]